MGDVSYFDFHFFFSSLTIKQWAKERPEAPYVDKPFGYSFFPCELFPVPGSWAGTLANLVHFKRHESGGHFAVSEADTIATILELAADEFHRLWRGRSFCSRMSKNGFQRHGRWVVELSSKFFLLVMLDY